MLALPPDNSRTAAFRRDRSSQRPRPQGERRHQRLLNPVRQLKLIANTSRLGTLPADKTDEESVGHHDERKGCDRHHPDALP